MSVAGMRRKHGVSKKTNMNSAYRPAQIPSLAKIGGFLTILIVCVACGVTDGQCQISPGAAKTDQVVALGSGRIMDENVAAARQSAIASAISKGVEYYLITTLGQRTMSENLDRVVEAVIPRSKELVENYQVVKETQIGDRYTVLIRMRINKKLAAERLQEEGLLSTETKPIRILFLVGSALGGPLQYWWSNPADAPPLSPTELVLLRAFQDKGYELINRTISLPSQDITQEMKQADLDQALICKWGEVFGADVVIYGKSSIEKTGQVSFSLAVVGVRDGKEHCRLTRAGMVRSNEDIEEIVQELENIASAMMPSLEGCIENATATEMAIVEKFEVTLKGLQSYSQYKKLREFLSTQIPGVKAFRQSRIGSHYVSFEVEFQGDEDKFANLVMYHDSLPVSIGQVDKRDGEIIFIVGKSEGQ